MRPVPLVGFTKGINRLRIKGGASAQGLYDLLNAYINQQGVIVPREGTIRAETLDSSTVGLAALNGTFNVFGTSYETVPDNYQCNVLINPNNTADTLSIIWFAQPFMGFLYVVAEFASGDIFHYWLQDSGKWTADTVYTESSIVTPVTPNGLAYQAVRTAAVNPTWAPDIVVSSGDFVEPVEYTGYIYEAVAVAGSAPHTGSVEPTWPTASGGTVQEFGDFDASSTASVTGSSTATVTPLDTAITDRYGDSATIAGFTESDETVASIPTVAASTKVTTWQPGTLYAPGSVVQPSTSQGAYIDAVTNGDFETGDDTGWTLGTGWTVSTDQPYQGTYCAYFSHTGSGFYDTIAATPSTVAPGQSVTATAYARGDSDGQICMLLRWYDSGSSIISTSKGALGNGGGGSVNPANYGKISITATAPAGAATVAVGFEFQTGSSSARSGHVDLVTWNLEQPAAITNLLYEAIQANAASSGSSEPSWPDTPDDTVIDGGVTWEALGTSIITWEAIPIMQSGGTEPTWPTVVGESILDASTFTDSNSNMLDTSVSWECISRQITDTNCPNTKEVCLGASHVFAGSKDIVAYCAAVNPTDWTSANNAGYLPTGLNNYGANPVAVLGLYRSNLMVFNSGGYQMWQIDPDPANMALLDAEPVGSIYTRGAQGVANDELFVSEVGVRNIGVAGATANLQVGDTGQPADPLVVAALQAGTYDPISLYYPGRGQYWLIFGPQAFVLTMNGTGQKTWSRYVFPDAITDWTLSDGILYLRSAGNLVWQIDAQTLVDDAPGAATFSASVTASTYSTQIGFSLINNPYGPNAGASAIGSVTASPSFGTMAGLWKDSSTGYIYLVLKSASAYVPFTAFTSLKVTTDQGVLTVQSSSTADEQQQEHLGTYYTMWAWATTDTLTSTDSYGFTFAYDGPGASTAFSGVIQWPYLDAGTLGRNKMMVGIDIVGDGDVALQVGFDQADATSFYGNSGFSTSSSVTSSYTIAAADTVPGQPIPLPINAPSYSPILIFAGNQAWSMEAVNLYVSDAGGAGATG